jgi:hypothetical protein
VFRLALKLGFLAVFVANYVYSQLEIAEEADARARQNYIDRFSEFTKEKNVMGKANSISGEVLKAKGKTRFNNDDKNNFENDLTYHKNTYEVYSPEKDPNDPNKKIYKKLPGWISAHGKVSQGGGSSQLERTVYKEHQKLAKEQEDPRKKKKPEKGVEYDSIFKTTTVDVKKDPNDPNSKDYTVARTEIVEEPLKEIEKVGTNSAEGIIKAGKESEFRNDANAMPNMAFLYESARRGVVAMWNSATANLAQRRANKSIESGRGLGVNEDYSSCDKWGQATLKAYKNPSATDQKLIAQQIQDCKLLMSKNYKDINPEIDTKKDANNNIQTTVKNGDFKTEDEKERDLRAQINVIDKAGIRLNEVQTNWNYTDKDEKAKVVTSYTEDGRPNQTQDLRVDEQIDLYNKGLQEAAESYEKIKKNLPTLNTNPKDILANQIQMKSKRIDQIMEIPPSVAEEFGLKKGPSQQQLPQYYEDLQNTK